MNEPLHSSQQTAEHYLSAKLCALVIARQLPQAKLLGGGINSLGFYYDVILEQPWTDAIEEWVEVDLQRMVKEDLPIQYISMMRDNAIALFEYHHHPFLALRAAAEQSNIIELVQIGDFYDLCPSLPLHTTQEVGVIKVLGMETLVKEIQGEEKKITRLLGTSRQNRQELKKFLKNYERYLKNGDHRLLGPKLNLFSFSKEALGVQWHSKGLKLKQLLQDWLNSQTKEQQQQISTPLVVQKDFIGKTETLAPFPFEKSLYCLRNSPFKQHLQFLTHLQSDEEQLPLRLVEYAQIYNPYPDPQWWGLFCTCAQLVDYHTIYLRESQVHKELISSLQFIEQMITIFGFEAHWVLVATRPKNRHIAYTKKAREWLRQAMQAQQLLYPFDHEREERSEENREEEVCRLELRIQDALGREWPVSMLAITPFFEESKFFFKEKTDDPLVILKRQVLGSIERFIALLIEHFEGNLPLWLSPEQVRVLAIGESSRTYAKEVAHALQHKGLRVGLDMREAKLSARVHQAEKECVPYLVFLGEEEKNKGKLNIRRSGQPDQKKLSVDLITFVEQIYQKSLFPSLMDDKEQDKS